MSDKTLKPVAKLRARVAGKIFGRDSIFSPVSHRVTFVFERDLAGPPVEFDVSPELFAELQHDDELVLLVARVDKPKPASVSPCLRGENATRMLSLLFVFAGLVAGFVGLAPSCPGGDLTMHTKERLDRFDPGKAGTFRFVRIMRCEQTQAEFGACCNPPFRQPSICLLEEARMRMHGALAQRIAPAAFPDLYEADPRMAVEAVWESWFTTVFALGSPAMKRVAAELKDARSWCPPLLKAALEQQETARAAEAAAQARRTA